MQISGTAVNGFHSTKEGFKASCPAARGVRSEVFPFHQGRFQGTSGVKVPFAERKFPFHQGRFQGGKNCVPPPMLSSCFHSTKEGFKAPRLCPEYLPAVLFPFHQGRFQGGWHQNGKIASWEFPFHQGRFQGRSATSAPMFVQYSTSLSEKSVQGEKAASPCKQAVMQLSQTCVDPPPFSRHRGATHSLQEHTSKI